MPKVARDLSEERCGKVLKKTVIDEYLYLMRETNRNREMKIREKSLTQV